LAGLSRSFGQKGRHASDPRQAFPTAKHGAVGDRRRRSRRTSLISVELVIKGLVGLEAGRRPLRHAILAVGTLAAGWLLTATTLLYAEQLSTGEPHKWVAITNKSMYDFVADGFE
jgi:hypothetical protein